ncbi:conserved hypothetical protein [Xenorhabdus bovienii str. oregonense]|uniref:Insertion element IS1 n=1 Tax=Xenorhabdus bovienii str. oregonense TaxID=1398202 RepID=A0A077PAB8_XENBV|nr:conserved hypothetical protein [Xenorhabdus bovienii str. oregonense]
MPLPRLVDKSGLNFWNALYRSPDQSRIHAPGSNTPCQSLIYKNQRQNRHGEYLQACAPYQNRIYCTDDYVVYDNLPEGDHLTGKTFTQRIERTNFTQRTRVKRLNRKTISYSKSEEMHDKVIGTFIEREYYF